MPGEESGRDVSVVVPSYNRPDVLLESLSSIEDQTYDDIEVVVVDDASSTPVEEVLDGFRSDFPYPLTVIRHDTNKGASAARNTGIQESEGEFVAFLDDDDMWEKGKMKKQVDRLHRAGDDAGVAYTGMRIVDGSGDTTRRHVETLEGDVTKELLRRNFVGSFSTVMVRTEAIEDAGLLDERFPCWQDIEWYIRLSEDWNFVAVPEPLVRIRQDESREHISDDFDQIRDTALELFAEKYQPLARSYGRLFEREFLGWLEFRVGAYNALRTGRYASARRHLLNAVRYYPFVWQFWVYLVVALGGRPLYKAGRWVKRRKV
jgi:glycosyltransferase involved in cell wall biosynthesis